MVLKWKQYQDQPKQGHDSHKTNENNGIHVCAMDGKSGRFTQVLRMLVVDAARTGLNKKKA